MSNQQFLPVPAAVEIVTGVRPTPCTAWRWTTKGSRGRILKSWVLGGRRMTTVAAVEAFIEQRTADTTPAEPVDQTEVSAALEKELA